MAALLVAALVPMLAAFAATAVLVPRAAAQSQRAALERAAAQASRELVRTCGALGDRAALLATRLQSADGDPAAAARRAVATAGSATRDGGSAVAVYDGSGRLLAAAGAGAVDLPNELGGATASCSRADGVVGDHLVENVATGDDGARALAAVTLADIVAPASAEPVTVLVVRIGGQPSQVASGGPGVDRAAAGLVLDRVTAADSDPVGHVAGLGYAAAAPVGELTAVAVAPQLGPSGWMRWLLVSVAAAFLLVVGLLAALLSRALARPVTRLSRLARDVGGDEAGARRDEFDLVAERFADLVGGLRSAEGEVARSRASLVASFGGFGLVLDQQPDLAGFLRAVGEAAMVAVDAHLVVVSVIESAPAPDQVPRTDTPPDAGTGPRGLTVTLFSPGDNREAPPVVLDEQSTGLADLVDLDAARHGMQRLHDTPPGDVTGAATEALDSWSALVPMRYPGGTLGHIGVVRRPGHGAPDAASTAALATLVSNAATALANVGRHRETALLSVTDPLTGVGNVRHLNATLTREVERAVRFGHTLAVLMVDLDHFKQVNDTHGHPRGDEVLVEVARRLSGCVREVDTVARYGGEEFCLLLPETDIDGGLVLAQRLLTAVADEAFATEGAPDVHLTISVGIAAHPVHGRSGADLMRVADAALYQAKRDGRNRAVAAAAARVPSATG